MSDLLKEENARYTVFPIKYKNIWDMYKKMQAAFWTAEEIDWSKDKHDFKKLNENEQRFIKYVLAFFSASDTIVNINLGERLSQEVQPLEAKIVYQFQMMIENVHCVSGDTHILTENGYINIKENLEKQVKVWNGKQFSDTIIKYTGDSELYHVKLDNGMELKCTPNHKWFIRTGNQKHPEACKKSKIETKDLKIGDVIYPYNFEAINTLRDIDEFKNPYIHGFFCGDGTYCNKYPMIYLYNKKRDLLKYFDNPKCQNSKNPIKFYITDKINKEKYFVPINYSIKTKLEWLAGVCDADGCVSNFPTKKYNSIQLSNTNLEFLKNIQLLLSTVGCNCVIRRNHKKRQTLLPDGKGTKKLYDCKEVYILYINPKSLTNIVKLGFNPKRLKVKIDDGLLSNSIRKSKLIKIKEILKLEGIHDTYCFTEKFENAGVFNGILTGQSETYALQIDNIIEDKDEKKSILNAIETVPCIKEKTDWMLKWVKSEEDFGTRLVAQAIAEGLFFSGSFCAIFWLKQKNIMPGLISSNELIARDEGMHCDYSIMLYKMLDEKLEQDKIHEMFKEAVETEKIFICDSLPCSLLGMNAELMEQYIKFVADRLIVQLGYEKIWKVDNPFTWMEAISIEGKTNFFEHRPTQYQRADVQNKTKNEAFDILDDF